MIKRNIYNESIMTEIRLLTLEDDLYSVLQLLHQLSAVTMHSVENYTTQMNYIINNKNHDYYLLCKEESIIGLGCLFLRETVCHHCRPVGYIEDVVIDSNERGKGYGKQLVKFLINKAKQKDCYKVMLHCDPKLTNFYKGCGIEIENSSLSAYFG